MYVCIEVILYFDTQGPHMTRRGFLRKNIVAFTSSKKEDHTPKIDAQNHSSVTTLKYCIY